MELESSYPPDLFRHLGRKDDQGSNLGVADQNGSKPLPMQDEETDDPIPVIDLEHLDYKNLDEACRNWGVFHLVNHGVPATRLAEFQDHARRVFGLPFETKQAAFASPASYFWGTPVLTPAGSTLARGGPQKVHPVEGMNFPLSQLSLMDSEVSLVNSFRELLREYGEDMARISTSIFQAMARSLQLDLKECASNLSESTGFVRVYRYLCPSMSGLRGDALGMEAHTDSSVMAIICQDEVGGLEVWKDGRWVLVRPIPNALVVNIGDMMQAMSDDKYLSVNHRVRVAGPVKGAERDRISICYFVFPGAGSVIRSSVYRAFTYEEFRAQVQQDVRTLGSKVGLDRFRLGPMN